MSKYEKKICRLLDKYGFQLPYHMESVYQNLIEAAEILSTKELVQMMRDYGLGE